MAVEKRDDICVCLARAEGYALALLDAYLVTDSQNTMMGVELAERSTLRDWELQSRDGRRRYEKGATLYGNAERTAS